VLKKEYFSKKKADADHDRDKVLTGLTNAVRATTKHFDLLINNNAKHNVP
jgi:hypothetical protein